MIDTSTHWRKRNLSKGQLVKIRKILGYEGPFSFSNPEYYYQEVRPGNLQAVFHMLEALGASQADWAAIFPPVKGKMWIGDPFVDIQELPLPLAVCLGRWKYQLAFHSLKKLAPEAAEHLARVGMTLTLPLLDSICDQTALALGKHKGVLYLGVKELSETAAWHLSRYQGTLHLDRLERLSREAAIRLSGSTPERGLHALKGIHPEICGQCVEMGDICFSFEIADEIARYEARLEPQARELMGAAIHKDLEGNIESVCDKLVETGANHGDWYLLFGGKRAEMFFNGYDLPIPGLTRLPVELARCLFDRFIKNLLLDGLVEIQAEALGFLNIKNLQGNNDELVSLQGLRALDDASAEVLAQFGCEIHLGSARMSDYARKLLDKGNVKYFGADGRELELEG